MYLMLHEPPEFDSHAMPSYLSAKMHRASWGPGKLTATPAQEEPPQQLLTAKEMQLCQSELLSHLNCSNNCKDCITVKMVGHPKIRLSWLQAATHFHHNKNKFSKVHRLLGKALGAWKQTTTTQQNKRKKHIGRKIKIPPEKWCLNKSPHPEQNSRDGF